jgi:hypothetical protein
MFIDMMGELGIVSVQVLQCSEGTGGNVIERENSLGGHLHSKQSWIYVFNGHHLLIKTALKRGVCFRSCLTNDEFSQATSFNLRASKLLGLEEALHFVVYGLS